MPETNMGGDVSVLVGMQIKTD